MNEQARLAVVVALLLAVALTAALPTSAQDASPDAAFDLVRWTIDGGGGLGGAGSYSAAGTIGQADAGALSGGSYQLTGGFWGAAAPQPVVYLPMIVR